MLLTSNQRGLNSLYPLLHKTHTHRLSHSLLCTKYIVWGGKGLQDLLTSHIKEVHVYSRIAIVSKDLIVYSNSSGFKSRPTASTGIPPPEM